MLGRQNKNLVIKLLKGKLKKGDTDKYIYYIILTKKRSKTNSRLDKVGTVGYRRSYCYLKLDLKKLTKYLVDKRVKITTSVWKVLGFGDYYILFKNKRNVRKSKKKKIISRKYVS